MSVHTQTQPHFHVNAWAAGPSVTQNPDHSRFRVQRVRIVLELLTGAETRRRFARVQAALSPYPGLKGTMLYVACR